MKENISLKWLGIGMVALSLACFGIGCADDDDDTGANVSAEIDELPPADLSKANVEEAVGMILAQVSPMDMAGMSGFTGMFIPSFSPPRPQAEITEGCMTITYPDDIFATSGKIKIELNNCTEAADGISGDGVMEFTFSTSGDYNYSIRGSVDITDGSDFIDMVFSISANMTSETSGNMTSSMSGSLSDPENSGVTLYLDVDQTVQVSGGVYTMDMEGKYGSTKDGKIEVTGDDIKYSEEECYGIDPFAGTVTITNGVDTAVVTINGEPDCGTGNLTINGDDQGQIYLY